MRTITQAENTKKRITVTVRLPRTVDRAVEGIAHERDIPKQQVIEEALRSFLGMEEAA